MSENGIISEEVKTKRPEPNPLQVQEAAKEFNGKTFLEIATEIATLRQEVAKWKEEAYLDPLTNVFNRRGMEDMFEKIKGVLKREKAPFENYGILFIDAVGLKAVNDQLGEAEGDKRIISIAEAAKKTTRRANEIVARVGGDEFMLIVPNLSEEDLRNLVTRLLENLPQGTALNIGACLWGPNTGLKEAFRRSAEAASRAKSLAKQDINGRSKEGFTVYFIENGQ